LLLCLGRLRVVLIVGTKRKFDSSSRHFFLYFLYMSNISNRLDEIELKQEMSKRIFFQLNKEIKKIRKFVDEYCDSPDAPLAVVVKFNSIICIYGIKNWRLVAI